MLKRSVIFFFLFLFLAAAAASFTLSPADQLEVGKNGLKLYPRWNKAFKPLAHLKEGEKLTVLRTLGSWRNVRSEPTGKEGWVYCMIEREKGSSGGIHLSKAASPTMSGLVTKGWSDKYAGRRGAGMGSVKNIMIRSLDCKRYNQFTSITGNVYYGDIYSFRSPCTIRRLKVFDKIPAILTIKKENLNKDSARYHFLIQKANKIFREIVDKTAREKGYDLIVERGGIKAGGGARIPDITRAVIAAIPQ